MNTGHAHPRVAAAIAAQAARGIHLQQNIVYHQPGLELHDRLPRRFPNAAPGAEYGLFLSNSGAEAIEAAVKLAKMATHRTQRGRLPRRVPRPNARCHGADQLGRQVPRPFRAAAGRRAFRAIPLSAAPRAATPPRWRTTMAALDELFATLVYPDDVAAFLVEPILGEGGYVVPPDGFLPALREVADRHGILLIVDEVQTGYARTGRFFATEWTDARPDIVVMAKGIASGLPLSGIMASRELLGRFSPGAHGGTYGGNAVACAAALATLDVIDDERLADRATAIGTRLLDGLRTMTDGRSASPRCAAAARWWPSNSPTLTGSCRGRISRSASSPRRWPVTCCSSHAACTGRWCGSFRRS